MRDGVRGGTGTGEADEAEAEAVRAETEERYRELVRLVYFVLPGSGKRGRRLAMARRIVETTSALGGGYERHRTRVLRRAMRPSPLWRVGLRPWLRRTPRRLPPVTPVNAMAALEPPVRVAYALLNVAGLARYDVRDQLLELRVADPMKVIAEAERAEVPPVAMRPHADPFAPRRGIRPVGRRPVAPVVVGVGAAAALLAGFVVAELEGGLLGGTSTAAARDVSLVAASPDAWRTSRTGLDVWPARGDLAADKAFSARVLHAWSEATGRERPGEGNPQLLFAGHVDGRKVALVRRGDRIGRFTGADGRMTVTRAGTDASSPLPIARGRYLVAPWDRVESLEGRRLQVRQGVTDPAHPRTRCGRGPVMHLKGGGRTATVGDFGGPRAVPLTYHSPAYVEGAARSKATSEKAASRTSGKGTLLRGRALRVWERVACSTPRPSDPVGEATAWEFWSGRLPLGGGPSQWVCTGTDFGRPGSSAQAVLLDRRGAHGTGGCDGLRPVGGHWWRSGRGDWYYLAAAARGLTPQVRGPFRATRLRSRLLVAAAKGPERPPAEPVTLGARPIRPAAR